MYYKEFLRARKIVYVYALIWAIVFIAVSMLSFWLPMATDTHHKGSASSIEIESWPPLVAVAALLASIISTILGSTLAQENDGHLELALTKPYSRSTSALALIGVDMAAIIASVLIGLAFILLHFVIFHQGNLACCQQVHLVAGPDPVFNTLRFLLFPLAWYAIIVGLSAGLRNAGVVQGLIWPVTLGLAALREVPSSGVWQAWHTLFVALNIFNPLLYVSYHDSATDTSVMVASANALPAAIGAAMLAAFVIAGWLGATWQWRRVEA